MDDAATSRALTSEERAVGLHEARRRLAGPRQIWVNPYLVILEEITRTYAHVRLLEEEVRRFDAAGGAHHAGREGQRALRRYNEERDRLLKASESAVRLGISDRHVRVAERQGELMARLVVSAAERLNLTSDQRQELLAGMRADLAELRETDGAIETSARTG